MNRKFKKIVTLATVSLIGLQTMPFSIPIVYGQENSTDVESVPFRFSAPTHMMSDEIFSMTLVIPANISVSQIVLPEGIEFDSLTQQTDTFSSIYDEQTREIVLERISTDLETSDSIEETALAIPETHEEVLSISLYAEQAGEYIITANGQNQTGESITNAHNLSISENLSSPEEMVEPETTNQENTVDEETPQQSKASTRADEANVANVTDWASFGAAIKNPTINVINLMNDIANPSTSADAPGVRTYLVTRDLEINGNGHRLDFQNSSINLGDMPTGTTGNFHMHDLTLAQRYGGGYSEDIVGSRLAAYSGEWRYRFGNITTEPSVQRLARAEDAQVTVYGHMDIDTRAENFYLGSFIMEDNTHYVGNVNYYNFSVIWYNVISEAKDTGASKEFTVGQDCYVKLSQTQTSGTTYPAIYLYYQAITIGENSTFNVAMPGNAVRFDMANSSMTVKPGATVNLTSKQNSGSVVAYSTNNSSIVVEPGASFYVIGNSNRPLIDLTADGLGTGNTGRQGNSLTLNNPKQYDIRNLRAGNYPAVQVNYLNNVQNSLTINDSDIDLWNINTEVLGPSSQTYANVQSFNVTGGSANQKVTTTDTTGLANFTPASYRRIAGMNEAPSLEFEPVTDAHKTIKARVKIGHVPDNNGADDNGVITYLPVYASAGQAVATITDTHGNIYENLKTDANGYVTYTGEPFNVAGAELEGTVKRGDWESLETATVVVSDITPPTIAELTNSITAKTDSFSGNNNEPGATVTYTINGALAQKEGLPITTTVAEDGTWTLTSPDSPLLTNDVIVIYLTDQTGNTNPETDTIVYDATFKAATRVVVQDGVIKLIDVPGQINFESSLVDSRKQTIGIESMTNQLAIKDTRLVKNEWQLLASMPTPLTSTSSTHTLPNALRYSTNNNDMIINDNAVIIEQGKNEDDSTHVVSDSWTDGNGLSLTIEGGEAKSESYQGTIEWTLQDVPVLD